MNRLPRKLTVYLSAPPGDGLRPSREHFQEYVKPILVAAALDWDVVEGRREGDVRAMSAEKIRKNRRKVEGLILEGEEDDAIEGVRQHLGIYKEEPGGGDLILGRHTWKEYIRGLHEGWLGPLYLPKEPPPAELPESGPESPAHTSPDDASPQAIPEEPKKEEEEKPKTPAGPPPPYILPAVYASTDTPPNLPSTLPPSTALPLPHLLGILNTPIRIGRFLNRRQLADDTGRQVATFILSSSLAPYDQNTDDTWEQERVLEAEESDWHKSARAPTPPAEEGKERPWSEEMVIDERIGSRMRKLEDTISETPADAEGNSREWKGAAERPERIGWKRWFLDAFDMYKEEPKCKGWEDGLKGEEWE